MKSKCLNAKTTSFSSLGFELCHLPLFRVLGLSRLDRDWALSFDIVWDLGFRVSPSGLGIQDFLFCLLIIPVVLGIASSR